MSKVVKARHWGLMVYPESAPENWVDILSNTHLQFAVSPLHDKDTNPDGELKKEHWHVILSWDGPQRQSAANSIANMLNSPLPIKLESVRGAYRYFTHKDNPEKYQYNESDIKVFNGFDISNYVALTKEEKYEAISKIKKLIINENIVEYIDLLSILEELDYNLFKVACDNTFTINVMVRSNRHKENK